MSTIITKCFIVMCVTFCQDYTPTDTGYKISELYRTNIDYKCLEDSGIVIESNICE